MGKISKTLEEISEMAIEGVCLFVVIFVIGTIITSLASCTAVHKVTASMKNGNDSVVWEFVEQGRVKK